MGNPEQLSIEFDGYGCYKYNFTIYYIETIICMSVHISNLLRILKQNIVLIN